MHASKDPNPRWLELARTLQSYAQTGLAFAADAYAQERYEAIRQVAFEMMATGFGCDAAVLRFAFDREAGYATPKVDVRAAVFRRDGKILLVKERADGRWLLPGGWLDVGESPREAAAREVREESGWVATMGRLVAVSEGQAPPPGRTLRGGEDLHRGHDRRGRTAPDGRRRDLRVGLLRRGRDP